MIIITDTRYESPAVGHAWETRCTACETLWKHTQTGDGKSVRHFRTLGTACQECFEVEGQASPREWEIARWYQAQSVRLDVERARRRHLT